MNKLIGLTTIRVIIIIFLLEVFSIFLDDSLYHKTKSSMEFGLNLINKYNSTNEQALIKKISKYVDFHSNIMSPLLYLKIGNNSYGVDIYYSLRPDEMLEFYYDCFNLITKNTSVSGCYALFDNRPVSKVHSLLNIVKISVICIVLSLGSYGFYRQINKLVLYPIRKIIEKINSIIDNPTNAYKKIKEEQIERIAIEEKNKRRFFCKKSNIPAYETLVLEKIINKISELLAKGINENDYGLYKTLTKEEEQFYQNKKEGVYIIFDIDGFEKHSNHINRDQIEILSEIQEIFEKISYSYGGNFYQIKGSLMLLNWNESCENEINSNSISIQYIEKRLLVENSLICIIKIIIEIYQVLNFYKNILEKTNTEFDITFGITNGWSIEGIINSSFKLDKQFLGRNVFRANNLRQMNMTYQTRLLFDDSIYNSISEQAKTFFRPVDKIKFIDDLQDYLIYTLDMDTKQLNGNKELNNMTLEKNLADFLIKNIESQTFQNMYNEDFHKNYKICFDDYIKGDWLNAKKGLENIINKYDDKISKVLYDYMKIYDFDYGQLRR